MEPPVVIVADDLIWSTRLADLVTAIGRRPVVVRSIRGLVDAAPGAGAVIVDLTARAYDGIAAIEAARAAGRRVLAVAQHDDAALRARARSAGAARVVAYRVLAERGAETLTTWLAARARPGPTTGTDS
jgi:DNA-binding NarL/FixJ family response regulator